MRKPLRVVPPASPGAAATPASPGSARRSCETTLRTELYVESGGERFELSQACHLWVIPARGVRLPVGRVRVVSVIEGHRDAWDVTLGPVPVEPGPGDEGASGRVAIRSMSLIATPEAA